ncbi:MAG: hypothetical protein K2P65_04270 [Lachnospiraceae bacterium]|nr:hypothetical protein [Lachnospiraceae bacterium]
MEQIELTAVAALLDQTQKWLKGFRKETYADSFEAFMEENRELWVSFRRLFLKKEESLQAQEAVAVALTTKMQELLDAGKSRRGKEETQLDVGLYLVSYVFPALLSCQENPKSDGNAAKMADAICKKWNGTFRGHTIQYADFASIQNGFKQKLCYVTTAICQGLHKSQNCREVQLMKAYRDEYLVLQEGGEEITREYYDIAPTIVKRIAKEASPEEKYQYLWEHYLQFCVAMVESGKYEECKETYMQMIEELKREYLITDHHVQ